MKLAGLLVLSTMMAAQTAGNLGVPTLGSIYDPGARAIRPVLGVAGASLVGEPWINGRELEVAEVSPDGAFALGAGVGGALLLVTPGTRSAIAEVPGPVTKIRFSPRGRVAVVATADGRLHVLKGLPAKPEVAWAGPGESSGALAVDDSGETVLAAREGFVLRYRRGAENTAYEGTRVGALDFLADSSRALLTDVDSVSVLDDQGATRLAGGLAEPVAAVGQGSRVLIALRSGELLWSADGQVTPAASCPCSPAGLTRQRENGLFRLNGLADAPVWMADTAAAEARLFFFAFNPGGGQ